MTMTDPHPKPPTLSYARGNFDKPPLAWKTLRQFDYLAIVWMVLLNAVMFRNLYEKLRTPPVPPPPPWDEEWVAVAQWQYSTALCDTALSIVLLGILIAAVWAMGKPTMERRAVRLHYVYVVLKLILVLTLSLLWGWSVDKAKMAWSEVAYGLVWGAFHPAIVLALLRQVNKELRKRRGD